MRSTTFHLETHSEPKKQLVKTTKRTETGILTETMELWPNNAPEECGGAGLYSTSDDYIKVLSDLLQDKPTILEPKTIDLMFAPQIKKGTLAIRDLHNSVFVRAMTGVIEPNNAVNFGLGGLYIEENVGNHKKNTLTWGGAPNLFWFANRANGIAGFYASQIIPPGDPKSIHLAQEFIKDVYQTKEI